MLHGIQNKPPSCDFCTVTFVKQPSFKSLDAYENKCISKLNIQIKIQSKISFKCEILLFLFFGQFLLLNNVCFAILLCPNVRSPFL